jgi:hypothetical protein
MPPRSRGTRLPRSVLRRRRPSPRREQVLRRSPDLVTPRGSQSRSSQSRAVPGLTCLVLVGRSLGRSRGPKRPSRPLRLKYPSVTRGERMLKSQERWWRPRQTWGKRRRSRSYNRHRRNRGHSRTSQWSRRPRWNGGWLCHRPTCMLWRQQTRGQPRPRVDSICNRSHRRRPSF